MERLKSYLKQTVKKSVRHSLYLKLKELQQRLTELNVMKAMKREEHRRLTEAYDSQLAVIDSEDGSMRDFRTNRYAAIDALNKIDDELQQIEASLQMLDHMKEETEYEIMMIRKLKGKEVST
ncbi:hypothetical protein [Macrococcus equipercicus]|uniref:Uncharacterized protein n=1 Tax=Macrococcus equipercicus TaxID=69967 RepID=A0A9Q9BKR8_9STAP|nr:hypothetical protein [Macrococcus equipercicus]KAA1037686.1 hypothetical protein ERX35_009000 [Macrococcus equipercicus]UTH13398.1 hypothetical protein KFV11_09205 [Macrococcus equipercicus]